MCMFVTRPVSTRTVRRRFSIMGGTMLSSQTSSRSAFSILMAIYVSQGSEITLVVPYLRGLSKAIFQQDNARPYVVRRVLTFHDTQGIRLLTWPIGSPDLP
ncbi:hypothetical protein HNY73_014914 [Argiope bruennichi]|uniref:Uncharacterized protein n=1 Tax=Argiope bruennichi TaxID=94029 RepID=A0A8T0EUW1_ARGBR|nr:hypothetical protein HNY73_014914 [Argiope bruennichi]